MNLKESYIESNFELFNSGSLGNLGNLGYTPENIANKNQINGYAGIGADGKISGDQLPALAITSTFIVSTQAAMLALTAEQGDVAVRSDISKSFILREEPATVLANWNELLIPSSTVYTSDQIIETASRVFITPAQKIDLDKNTNVRTIMKDPTGFADPDNVIVNYDPITRTVTLTGTTTAYWQGTLVPSLVSGWTSDAHNDISGNWFLYYNGSSFVWSQTVWTFDMLQICFVNYGTIDKFAIRESHGFMDWRNHREAHETQGTYKISGGLLSGYTLASNTAENKRPLVSSCIIKDEDLITTNPSHASQLYTKMFLSSTNINNFTVETADIVPLSTNQPYYNQLTGGVWQQTLMSNNNYQALFLVAIPTTEDVGSRKYRFIWVQGQTQSPTLSTIQAITSNDVNMGQFSTTLSEFVFIQKVIIQYTASNWVINSVYSLTGTKFSQSALNLGGVLSVVDVGTGISGDGTFGNPITNNLITGVAGGQTAYGGTAANDAIYIRSTTNAAKGKIYIGNSTTATVVVNEGNGSVGIGTSAPIASTLTIALPIRLSGQVMTGSDLSAQRMLLRGNASDLTTGGVTIQDTTASSAFNNGALIVSGGIGCANNIVASGAIISNTGLRIVGSGYISNGGGAGLRINVRGNGSDLLGGVDILDTTASTSATTGALIVNGGVGLGGDLCMGNGKFIKFKRNADNFYTNVLGIASGGNDIEINVPLEASTATAITIKNLSAVTIFTMDANGAISIKDVTASTSSTTGALVVAGGVGIAGNLCTNKDVVIGVGGNLYLSSTNSLIGGQIASGTLKLGSTSHASKGKIFVGNIGTGTVTVNEGNGAVGIGTSAPIGNTLTITLPVRLSGQTITGSELTNQRLYLRGSAADLVSGGVTIQDTTVANGAGTGALSVAGGVYVAKGIQFPATQSYSADPNTFDDYEEGTWNPTLSDGINLATMKTPALGGGNKGYYTKKGNEVSVTALIQWTDLNGISQTGDVLYITGFPFICDVQRSTIAIGPTSSGAITASAGNHMVAHIELNQTYAALGSADIASNSPGGTLGTSANSIIYSISTTYFTTV